MNREELIERLRALQVLSGNQTAVQPPVQEWRQVRGLFVLPGAPLLENTYCSLAALEILGGVDQIDREACIRGLLGLHRGQGRFVRPTTSQPWRWRVRGEGRDTFCAFESLRILGALDRVPDLERWQFRLHSRYASQPGPRRRVTWAEIEAWVCQQRLERFIRERLADPQAPARSLSDAGDTNTVGSSLVGPTEIVTVERTVDLTRPTLEPAPTGLTNSAEQLRGQIAFVTGPFAHANQRRIWLMRPGDSRLWPLTENHFMPGEDRPAWSPDGKRIAFAALRDGKTRLYVRQANGQGELCITPDRDECTGPTWAPDGQRIAFEMAPTKARDAVHIFVVDLGGSDLRQLTYGRGYNWMARWSPDGKRIAFESTRDGNREIYVMDADGAHATNVTRNPAPDHAPAWSPDGTRIAFMSRREEANAEILVMNADGSGPVNLTHHPDRDSEPCWSPDGKWIAFTRQHGDPPDAPMDIWITSADGTGQRPLTHNLPGVCSWGLSWGP
ncbi:PD40 domain-containing protein [bacterium]|nr:PD40 domain-containing protein [bacterium]